MDKISFISIIQDVLTKIGTLIKTCINFIIAIPTYYFKFRNMLISLPEPFNHLFVLALTLTFLAILGKLISFVIKTITGGVVQ